MAGPDVTDRATPGGFRLGYRPALDGVRGLSVLAVMGYHAELSWLHGGFLGVDAFFVLSGFLITTLLVEEWQAYARISLRNFYARRLLRLVPALVLVLAAVAVYAALFAKRDAAEAIWPEAVSTILYTANWFSAYIRAPFPFHLSHTWSLSIEEQFYLVWPLVLLGLLSLRLRVRALLWVTVVGAAASAAWMLVMTGFGDHHLGRAYYGTDTRAQALLVGCVIGLAAMHGSLPRTATAARAARTLAWVGASFVVGLWVVLTGRASPFLYRGGFTLEALAVGGVVVHVLLSPASSMARALALGPLRWVGRISYGLYLWHLPIFLVVQGWDLDFWPGLVVKVGLTFAFAAASFYAFERPLLRLKGRFERTVSGRAAARISGAAPDRVAAPA